MKEGNILCFESGGSKLVVTMFDSFGERLGREVIKRKPEQRARETLGCLVGAGKKLAEKNGQPDALGWGFGGTVDRESGNPTHCYHEEGWGEFDSRAELGKSFGNLPVFIENDCNLAALSEAWRDGLRPPEMLYFATLGTGIGGGIIRRGEILQLSSEGEGEIGHLVVDPEGPECPCGNRGCLETYCSGPGLANLGRKLTGEARDSREIMAGFHEGEAGAVRIVEEAAGYLAQALAAVINILAPEEIVLGGGLMWGNAPYLSLIRKKTLRLSFPVLNENVRFRLSEQGEDLVCRGAYLHARKQFSRLQG